MFLVELWERSEPNESCRSKKLLRLDNSSLELDRTSKCGQRGVTCISGLNHTLTRCDIMLLYERLLKTLSVSAT